MVMIRLNEADVNEDVEYLDFLNDVTSMRSEIENIFQKVVTSMMPKMKSLIKS